MNFLLGLAIGIFATKLVGKVRAIRRENEDAEARFAAEAMFPRSHYDRGRRGSAL